MYFSFQLLYSSALFFFWYLLVLCWNSHYICPLFSPIQLAFLLLLLWTHYQLNYLPLFYRFFSGYFLISEIYPSVFSFCLTFSVSRKLEETDLDPKGVPLCDNLHIHSVTTTEWIGRVGSEVSMGHIFQGVLTATTLIQK